MKFVKDLNEFISSSKYSKLLSMVEFGKDDVYYRIFYTPVKGKVVSVETTNKIIDIPFFSEDEPLRVPFRKGDDIERVYGWIKENDIEIVKIKNR
jgi:hypothetical protein